MKLNQYSQRLAELSKTLSTSLEAYRDQVKIDRVRKEFDKLRNEVASQGLKKFKQLNDDTLGTVERAHREYLKLIKVIESKRKYAESEIKSAKTVLVKKSKTLEKQFDSVQKVLRKKKTDLEKVLKSYNNKTSRKKAATTTRKKAAKTTRKTTVKRA